MLIVPVEQNKSSRKEGAKKRKTKKEKKRAEVNYVRKGIAADFFVLPKGWYWYYKKH